MKRNILTQTLAFVFAILIPVVALAQAASLPADLPTADALELLLKSVGGLKGAGALAIAAFCVQAVLLFFRTPLAGFAGRWRLLVVAGLTLVFGFMSMLLSGVDWKAAIVHADVLLMLQVFANQIWKQFVAKGDEPSAPKVG